MANRFFERKIPKNSLIPRVLSWSKRVFTDFSLVLVNQNRRSLISGPILNFVALMKSSHWAMKYGTSTR